MTQYADMLYHLDGVPVGLGVPFSKNSDYFFADPANGNAACTGTLKDPASLVSVAEDKCVANQHDTVLYIAGPSGNTEPAALVWDKNYTHLIGIAAPSAVATRSRIFALSTLTNLSPFLTISASGCIFKNFYIFHGLDDAGSLINTKITGGRNYFENVHFAGGGHATQAINGGASLLLDGAEENLFYRCTIGVDTVDAATGMMGLLFDGEAHRNVFRECIFRMRAGHTGAGFVEILDATGIDRDNTFIDCLFINNATAFDMASAFVIPTGMGEPRSLLLKDCMFLNVTKLDANDRGVLFGNMNAITGADLSGVAVEMIT